VLQFGVWNGLQYQVKINNHFCLLVVGIKLSTFLIQMDKKEIGLVKDIFHATQYQ
jgi:hypothetical protein